MRTGGSTSPPLRNVTAYPNPFNPSVRIRYTGGTGAPLVLAIHDAAGRTVRCYQRVSSPAGTGDAIWDGRDDQGRPVAGGCYLVQLTSNDQVARSSVVLVK